MCSSSSLPTRAAAPGWQDAKHVIVAGLDGDFQRRRFGQVRRGAAGGGRSMAGCQSDQPPLHRTAAPMPAGLSSDAWLKMAWRIPVTGPRRPESDSCTLLKTPTRAHPCRYWMLCHLLTP